MTLEPGQTCEECGRKVPYPKRSEQAARFLGTSERPHERFWTVTFALATVLQDESLRGAGQRSPVA